VWLAETGSEPVGFLLALPDFNGALKSLRGKWQHRGISFFCPYLFVGDARRAQESIHAGSKEKYRNRRARDGRLSGPKGLGLMLKFRSSLILEDNIECPVLDNRRQTLQRYRIFEALVESSVRVPSGSNNAAVRPPPRHQGVMVRQ